METINATCECCGNVYDKPLLIRAADGTSHVFDSFECAIDSLAPRCGHCGCRIIGHGVEDDGQMFCCANCARLTGITAVADRADAAPGVGAEPSVGAPTRPPADS